MDTHKKVLSLLEKGGASSGAALALRLGLSRQAVNKHLAALIKTGFVVKSGGTRGALFSRAGANAAPRMGDAFKRTLPVKGLQEDRVSAEAEHLLGLKRALNKNALPAFHYVFTEMLNNAIEHSRSPRVECRAEIAGPEITATVRDRGIGIFESIRRKFKFDAETDAMLELLKGKRTTAPERHTGEGIFFSSKVCDRFVIRSHRLAMTFDNVRGDVFSSDTPPFKGTEISFSLRRQTKRSMKAVFDLFAGEAFDYAFSASAVKVKFLDAAYVSRSEAKRLLAGLEKFREVVLDFRGVGSIGQGFADEVFRVFNAEHPEVKLRVENAPPGVNAMIRHVVDKNEASRG